MFIFVFKSLEGQNEVESLDHDSQCCYKQRSEVKFYLPFVVPKFDRVCLRLSLMVSLTEGCTCHLSLEAAAA